MTTDTALQYVFIFHLFVLWRQGSSCSPGRPSHLTLHLHFPRGQQASATKPSSSSLPLWAQYANLYPQSSICDTICAADTVEGIDGYSDLVSTEEKLIYFPTEWSSY